MNYFGITDIGLVRQKNQDSYITVHNENHDLLILVCDGIGGNRAGEIASSEIVKYFARMFPLNKGFKDSEEAITYLKYHVRMASNHVYDLSKINKDYEGMGTTITGILISSIGNYVINAGDSRVYGIASNDLFQLTKDHTLVNELIERRLISLEESKTHPKRHYITRFLGVYEDSVPEVYRVSNLNEYYLICSDGLHGYVDNDIIKKILLDNNMSLGTKANLLVDKAKQAGGYDNITLVIVDMKGV